MAETHIVTSTCESFNFNELFTCINKPNELCKYIEFPVGIINGFLACSVSKYLKRNKVCSLKELVKIFLHFHLNQKKQIEQFKYSVDYRNTPELINQLMLPIRLKKELLDDIETCPMHMNLFSKLNKCYTIIRYSFREGSLLYALLNQDQIWDKNHNDGYFALADILDLIRKMDIHLLHALNYTQLNKFIYSSITEHFIVIKM